MAPEIKKRTIEAALHILYQTLEKVHKSAQRYWLRFFTLRPSEPTAPLPSQRSIWLRSVEPTQPSATQPPTEIKNCTIEPTLSLLYQEIPPKLHNPAQRNWVRCAPVKTGME
jgi:hypothetical protein